MPPLSFSPTWMSELEKTVEEVVGQLDDQARAIIQVTTELTLRGHSEGLVELI